MKRRSIESPVIYGCYECVAIGKCCCTSCFADGWKIIILPGELKRISELTAKVSSEFIDTSPLSPSQLKWYVSKGSLEDPLWARLFSIWNNPTGLKDSCPFLQSEGCSLPYEDKPFLCRIFPLSFNISEEMIFLPKETERTYCLLAQNAVSIEKVLSYFEDDWERLQKRFKVFRYDFLCLLEEISGRINDNQEPSLRQPQQVKKSKNLLDTNTHYLRATQNQSHISGSPGKYP